METQDTKKRCEYPTFPIPAVGVAVVSDKGRILMIKRGKPPAEGMWSVPGGTIELGETVMEAARREVLEETSLDCSPYAVYDAIDAIYRDEDQKIRFHYVILYVAATCEERPPVARDDATEAEWFTLEEIRKLPTPGRTCSLLEKIFKKGIGPDISGG
ncbi:MAG: NUDIX hydrolase [Thermodesulfobacteria bacterium]|nr:NUDIX hydrolase [Thermodesulfobacteriota bacterium]